jgi:hypothetical protein
MTISYEITCLLDGKYRLRRLRGEELSLVGSLSRTDLEIYLVDSVSRLRLDVVVQKLDHGAQTVLVEADLER